MNLCTFIFLCVQVAAFQAVYSAQIHPEIHSQEKSYLDIDNRPFIENSCNFLALDKQIFKNLADEVCKHVDDNLESDSQLNDEEYCEASIVINKLDEFLFASEQLIVSELVSNPWYRDEFCTEIRDRIHKNKRIETSENRVARYLFDYKQTLALRPVLQSFINSDNHTFLLDVIDRQKPLFSCTHVEGFHYASDTLLDNVKFLIACGINLNQIDQQGEQYQWSGKTALHYAASCSAIKVVKLLVDAGADLYKEDARNYQAIDYAIQDFDTFSLLLDAPGYDLTKTCRYNRTLIYRLLTDHYKLFGPLSYASVLKLMIDKGADLTTKDRYDSTLLDVAVAVGNWKGVEILLEHINQQIITESHPLIEYRGRGYRHYCRIASTCLATGLVDINARDAQGNTPLNYWAKDGCQTTLVGCYRLLVSGEWKRIKFLIKQGADVNVQNNLGDTPLHSYAKGSLSYYFHNHRLHGYENNKIVSLLVGAGVNKALRNHENKTAVEYVDENHVDLIRLMTPSADEEV